MRHATLWVLLLTMAFWPLALPERSEGAEQMETWSPPKPDAGLTFIWPDGRRAPAMLHPSGIVTLPDGSVPQGGIRLQLPDGQKLPVPPSGRVDLSSLLHIQENGGGPQPSTQQTPGAYPPVTAGLQGEQQISLPTLSKEELTTLQQGTPLQLQPNGQLAPVTVLPDGSVRLQDGSLPQQAIQLLLPDGSLTTLAPGEKLDLAKLGLKAAPQAPGTPTAPPEIPSATTPQAKPPATGQAGIQPEEQVELPPLQASPAPAAPEPDTSPFAPAAPVPAQPQDILASLLPTTPIPPDFKAPDNGKPEAPALAQKDGKPEAPAQKKNSKPKARKAPRPGEPLSIPPEAVKTGDLSFLEGCWQGTRPEYYSKRTIRECFCFGKRGTNGKRRIIVPSGPRQCTGATQASLDKNGVLRVYSESAYCSDGVQWGAAEMTCRGSGQSTPCSWVFTDANGGRQSYQIPFIRVESCRR